MTESAAFMFSDPPAAFVETQWDVFVNVNQIVVYWYDEALDRTCIRTILDECVTYGDGDLVNKLTEDIRIAREKAWR